MGPSPTAALPSAVAAIGNTPLVALDRMTAGMEGRIVAKLEMLSPGFSKKDRAARRIIEEARRDGRLEPGQTVVELTSGNMGAGLAIVCAVLGHPFVAVMSRGNSEERAAMMRALGAEVVLVDQSPGSRPGSVSGDDLARAEEEARRVTSERQAFRADQFSNAGHANAHYFETGPEILAQAGGEIDAFCDFAGTGGTFAGVSRYFREQAPGIRCYVVEPEGAEAIAGQPVVQPDHPIQGGGYGMGRLQLLAAVSIDGFVAVSAERAIAATRRLAREEGIFAGVSSGANVAAALELLAGRERGSTIAVLVCDSGLKYLSTGLWSRTQAAR